MSDRDNLYLTLYLGHLQPRSSTTGQKTQGYRRSARYMPYTRFCMTEIQSPARGRLFRIQLRFHISPVIPYQPSPDKGLLTRYQSVADISLKPTPLTLAW
eukprot:scaffold120796_cov60-Phaeocystis_antarctica.AAC.1